MKKWELGASSGYFNGISEESFAAYRNSGVKLMEISLPDTEASDAIHWEKTAALAARYGVTLWSFHLPFLPFSEIDPSDLDEEKRQYTVRKFCKYIETAAAHGIRHFVCHASGEPIFENRESRVANAAKSFAALAEFAAKFDAFVAVEDLPRTCVGHNSDEIRRILDAHPRLRVAFDTNHLTVQENKDFVRSVGDRIVTTHVSDYDFVDERHLMPGEGRIDWPSLMRTLDAVGYTGPLIYELIAGNTTHITRKKVLTGSELLENYRALIAYRQPDPIDVYVPVAPVDSPKN